eukprot:6197636-Pleurochrysis_carterae.AAC.1
MGSGAQFYAGISVNVQKGCSVSVRDVLQCSCVRIVAWHNFFFFCIAASVYVGDSPSDGKAARNVPGLVYQRVEKPSTWTGSMLTTK